jgi:hypothetical protein
VIEMSEKFDFTENTLGINQIFESLWNLLDSNLSVIHGLVNSGAKVREAQETGEFGSGKKSEEEK